MRQSAAPALMVETTVMASRAFVGVVARSLATALEEVTLPQFRAMVILATHGPQRVGALADLVGVHQSTFTRTSDRLVKGGWVHRVDNPDNRREVIIELSAAGAALVTDVTDQRRKELAEILRAVPAAEREYVTRGMRAFAEAAGEPSLADLASLGM